MEPSTDSQTDITESQLQAPLNLHLFQALIVTANFGIITLKYAKERTSVCLHCKMVFPEKPHPHHLRYPTRRKNVFT